MALRHFHPSVPSTQTAALDLARAGAPEGTYVVATAQTRARGRGSHRWASPRGGLYLSVVTRTPHDAVSWVPLASALALREVVSGLAGVATRLKWPNDLIVETAEKNPQKLAGILVDTVDSTRLGRASIVGIGLNVRTPRASFPPDLRPSVAILKEHSRRVPSPSDFEEPVVNAVLRAVRRLDDADGASRAATEVREALYGIGHRATVDGVLTGIIRTVGDEGELWIEGPQGPVAVITGDLVIEEAT